MENPDHELDLDGLEVDFGVYDRIRFWNSLEELTYQEANELGIGPMGFGGKTTVLGVKVGAQHRLPASYFVSIAYMCWANRRASMDVSVEDGDVEQEMERLRIIDALSEACGNKKMAARTLGIHRSTLYAKLRRFGLLDHQPAGNGKSRDQQHDESESATLVSSSKL